MRAKSPRNERICDVWHGSARVAETHNPTRGGPTMGILGESVETPRALYVHKLGAALKMENKILEMLPQLEEAARDGQLQQQLRKHQQETKAHVRNLEQVFRALGEEPDEQACPTIEGLEKEGQSMLSQVDESLNDAVILSGVVETEAHEIAVYDGLITT